MDKCPDAFELADYVAYDLVGFRPVSTTEGLSPERRHEISEHCTHCNVCGPATTKMRDKKQKMAEKMDQMAKDRPQLNFVNYNDQKLAKTLAQSG